MSLEGTATPVKVLRGRISRLDTLCVSAYGIAVKNGFEGTEAEWLASLKGEKGDKGDKGDKGETGSLELCDEADALNTRIKNVADPKENGDAATKGYVDTHANRTDNPHGVTAEQVGAAPAGYGYGDVRYFSEDAMSITSDYHLQDLEVYLQNEENWGKVIRFSSFAANMGIEQGYADLAIQSSSNAVISYYLFQPEVGVRLAKRQKVWNTWYPLEWVNPPMIAGVEYRTTERYNGKAVYTKLINCGEVTTSTWIGLGGSSTWRLIDLSAVKGDGNAFSSGSAQNLPLYSGTSVYLYAEITFNGIQFRGAENAKATPVFATMKYTKD